MTRPHFLLLTVLLAGLPTAARAQPAAPAGPTTLTLEQAVQLAADRYPTVRAALEQVGASTAGIDVARSAYLPRLDALWQSNRATANNVFGQLLPQSVLPSLSGPVLPASSSDSVWSSATGALLSWDGYDFGARRSAVASAEAELARARARETLTRLDVQGAVASAYLNVVAAQQAVVAAQADLERRDVLRRAVQTLVDNQLRPGAEASRAAAEQAASRTRLIQAEQSLALAQTSLTRVLGMSSGSVTLLSDALLRQTPSQDPPPPPPGSHPLAQVHQATIDRLRAEEDVLARSNLPHVYLQSSVFARGSGASPDGTFDGGLDGLGLDRANWAAGVQVVIPNLFDFASLRARKAAAASATRSEEALAEEARLTISSQQQAAAVLLPSARAIAANTPLQLAAARESEQQARARFDAGLASIIEVADAQNLLAQAEVQDQLARVDVWRALLADAMARGDLGPFLTRTRQP